MPDTTGENTLVTDSGRVVLNPDPTSLTRTLIRSEVAALRDLLRAELQGETSTLVARLAGMDQAIVVFERGLTSVPTDLQLAIGSLDRLMSERFNTVAEHIAIRDEKFLTVNEKLHGIVTQINERDDRLKADFDKAGQALLTALTGQDKATSDRDIATKAANDKAEKQFKELLDQQRILNETNTQALRAQIDDLKLYRSQTEGRGTGSQQLWAGILAVIVVLIGFGSLLIVALR